MSYQQLSIYYQLIYGLEIVNIFIDLDSNEIPVCDGSSYDFVKKLENSGINEQSEFKKFIKLRVIEVKDDSKLQSFSIRPNYDFM